MFLKRKKITFLPFKCMNSYMKLLSTRILSIFLLLAYKFYFFSFYHVLYNFLIQDIN